MTAMPQTPAIDRHGWLHHQLADHCISPHQDARPEQSTICLLVVHCISLPRGCFGGPWIDHLFRKPTRLRSHPQLMMLADFRVSAHFFIDRNGHLRQYVSCARRAWHAGVSSFENRVGCNDFSIGVELEGTDDQVFETAQYRRLAELSRILATRYPLRAVRGHEHIAPGRKQDPGTGFDWPRFARATTLPRRWFPAT